MAEESIQDRLLNRIKKQTVIKTIKEFLKRNPKLAVIALFLKDMADGLKGQSEEYLGNADKVIVIGRRNGETRIFIIDGNKEFTLSTGLKLKVAKDALLKNEHLDNYIQEYIYDSGILNDISEEQKKQYEEMKSSGTGVMDFFKSVKINDQKIEGVDQLAIESPEQKQISSPE